jgi:hypothetical protein
MKSSRWTDEILDSMRQLGDAKADEAVADVFSLGQADKVSQVMRDLAQNSDLVPADLPPLIRHYFEESDLPPWADMKKIERGNDLLGRYAPQIVTILHCASLPSCYTGAKGVEVLYMSQRISGQVFRRIMETAQFVLDVMDEGGLGPKGRGRRSAQKIRLLHATIRYHMRRSPEWAKMGEMPINQEDLSGTMMSFSVIIPRGLKKLGIDLPVADRDAFYHIWTVVGYFLGIDERLIPKDFEDGSALCDRILDRQAAPSEAGQFVTKALVDYMKEMLPGPALDGVPATLIRHLIGDRFADILSVPPADWTRLALQVPSGINLGYAKIGDNSAIIAKLASQVGILMLKGAVLASNKGQRYQWRLPKAVNEKWGGES